MTNPRPDTVEPDGANVAVDGAELRRVRKRGGHTLGGLAERSGVSKQFLSMVERGVRQRMSPPAYGRVCDALGIDRDTLDLERRPVAA